MPELKTKKTKASVAAYLAAVENETRRADAKIVDKMFREITGEKPAMWGPSIIGFGEWASPSGKWPRVAFSPRKSTLVLYILADYRGRDALLKKLGKHETGVSCLYIRKLADVDVTVLRELMTLAWKYMASRACTM